MNDQKRSKRARTMSQDHRMTTRFQARRLQEENLRDVLNNRIVCENIASYLSFADMKAATEVSRKFLQAIRGTRRFAQKAVLTITDENLEDVKTFIKTTDYAWRGVKLNLTDPTNIRKEVTFMRNFGLLTGLPNRLKSFKLIQLPASKKGSVDSLHRSVLRLLSNNKATLEELKLGWSVWRIKEVQTLNFPALKALNASTVNLCDGDTLGEFLKNQRSLEELMLTVWEGPGAHLYTGMKECSGRLKKLHLTGRGRCFEEFDWSFLAVMSRLKDFRLKMWGQCGGVHSGNRLLASLPKNQLECLSLEGLWDMSDRPYGFWRFGVGENEFQVKTELLEGFRCLRRFSLLRSREAVDDQLMQWLLKEFVSMEELELSHCSRLTNNGITGKTTAEWGRDASFVDLRRLKTLKIVRCRGVTPNGVLASCVNVPWLKSLEYSNPLGPESVVMQLVDQNPRLERLTLGYVGCVVGDLEKMKAKVMKKNPRVKLFLAQEEDD